MPNLTKAKEILQKYLFQPMTGDLKTKIEMELKSAKYNIKKVRFSFLKRYISVVVRQGKKEFKIVARSCES